MAILQAGVPKSGNYWLYNIIESVAKQAEIEHRSFIQNHHIHEVAQTWDLGFAGQSDIDFLHLGAKDCYFRISAVFREQILDVEDYISQCSHVWTHSPIANNYSLEVLSKFKNIVYIIRDPRDIAISYSHFAFTPHKLNNHPPHYEKNPACYLDRRLDEMLKRWVNDVGSYLKHQDTLQIYPIFYERLLHSFDTELIKMLAYLGIELDAQALKQIKDEVTFSSMKKQSPNHLRKGKSSQWKQKFTASQKERAEKIAGPMLALLNYPISDTNNGLPYLPTELTKEKIEAAIAYSKSIRTSRVKQFYIFATSTRPISVKANAVRDWSWKRIRKVAKLQKLK